MKKILYLIIAICICSFSAKAQVIKDARDVENSKKLADIQKNIKEKDNIMFKEFDFGGKLSLENLLMSRHSTREYSDSNLTNSELGSILFAAKGVNRTPDTQDFVGYTVPSAMHVAFIDLYVFTKTGVYKWNPEEMTCELIIKKDIRKITGMQEFVAEAAVNIVMVADYSKPAKNGKSMQTEKMRQYATVEAGAISQNIYLAAEALKLGTVVRASFDSQDILNTLQLSDNKTYEVILAQTVGKLRE